MPEPQRRVPRQPIGAQNSDNIQEKAVYLGKMLTDWTAELLKGAPQAGKPLTIDVNGFFVR